MPATLNYTYRLLPTAPQRHQLTRLCIDDKRQWNKACGILGTPRHGLDRGLMGALACFDMKTVAKALLEPLKNDDHPKRQEQIAKVCEMFPGADVGSCARLYDLKPLMKAVGLTPADMTIERLAEKLEPIVRAEQKVWRAYRKATDEEKRKLPKVKTPAYWAIRSALCDFAGSKAKRYMDRTHPRPGSSAMRFNVSGGGSGTPGSKFERTCQPSPDQRALGNRGIPRFKRRSSSFRYQILVSNESILSDTHVKVSLLPDGLQWVPIELHREIPGKIKQLLVMEKGDGWYIVFSTDVPDEIYYRVPEKPEKQIGLDPGCLTALTGAVIDTDSGEISYDQWHWGPQVQSLVKLEHLQQEMSLLRGPDRRTHQQPSANWVRLMGRVRILHARIANQRKDILHKVARQLADHGLVVMGDWTPPKEVKGRKDFKRGKTEEVPQGPKGIKRARREARDRSNATLIRLTTEKCERAGTEFVKVHEAYTTRRCSACGALTGPRSLSIREWKCEECGAQHQRDQNAALNILLLATSRSGEEAHSSATAETPRQDEPRTVATIPEIGSHVSGTSRHRETDTTHAESEVTREAAT